MWLRYAQGYIPRWRGGSMAARVLAWFDINPVLQWGDVPTLKSRMLDDPGDLSHYHLVREDHASALWFAVRKRALQAQAHAEKQSPRAAAS